MFASKDLFLTRPSGYQISRSVRLRSSATAYFNRTPASAGNKKTWTYSAWVKYSVLDNNAFNAPVLWASGVGGTAGVSFTQSSNTAHRIYVYNGGFNIETTQVFRDPSGWYHILAVIDTTQATAANRTKLYVNGVQVTALATATYPSQNADSGLNEATEHNIGKQVGQSRYFDGYLTEINFIDGQALTPSSFGQTNPVTGVWQPLKYTGTYGTNGFYLNFSDNSNNTATTIGKDYSGNGNNWTPNNISVTSGATYDSMLDVPTLFADGGNGRGNYCVMNPVNATSAAGTSLSNGNLQINGIGSGNVNEWLGTIGASSGKWYYEVVMGENNGVVGISQTGNPNTYPGGDATSYGYSSSVKYNNGSSTAYGASLTAGDIVGVAYDLDAGTITFYKNGTSQGQAFSGLSGIYFPAVRAGTTGAAVSVNFGQRPFTYTPPSGYVALNTYNLPASTISNGATVMAATTYTGTGSTQSITNTVNGVSMKPDFVWMKSRSAATSHHLADTVRGIGATSYLLLSDSTAAESTSTTNITAVNSNGFTVGTSTAVNNSGATYVAWQWQAGQGSTSSNTSGSITSTVSVNATAGFSIVTYTGTGANATVGHGLGVAPSMVIVKRRDTTGNWPVRHTSITAANTVYLNTTAASAASTTTWNSTAPTSTVFSIGTSTDVNANTGTYVAYCFAAVAGYSAFGSYTGNGSADGPFVFTNFQPRWVMVKRTDTTSDWYIWDTSRDTYNVISNTLLADTSGAETSATSIDGLSNGFKCRSATVVNASGGTYIYAAFASSPFKLSLAR